MPHKILTDVVASMGEFKAHPLKVVASGHGMPVLVLNRNRPAFYCVPAGTYEAMMGLLSDRDLIRQGCQAQWLADNREAIAAYNEAVADHGSFGDSSREF